MREPDTRENYRDICRLSLVSDRSSAAMAAFVIWPTRPLHGTVVVGVAALGFLGILFCTPAGIGIYPDSVVYVGVARNLLQGQGVTYFDENGHMAPVTHYAPLYPLVIAGLGLTGIDPLEGARWVNAVFFAFNIRLVG